MVSGYARLALNTFGKIERMKLKVEEMETQLNALLAMIDEKQFEWYVKESEKVKRDVEEMRVNSRILKLRERIDEELIRGGA